MMYKQFLHLGVDTSLLCLEQCDDQPEFDHSRIRYSDEYYDVLGIEREGDHQADESMQASVGMAEHPTAQASVCFVWEE